MKNLKYIIKISLIISYLYPFILNGQIIYVNYAATGNNNGTSWADAYLDLQDALLSVQAGEEIWVAKGIYNPTQGTTDNTRSFLIVNSTKLYGGFNGNETNKNQAKWKENKTILSGYYNQTSRVRCVVNMMDILDTNTIINGFIIEGGNGGFIRYSKNYGGGIFSENSKTAIENCIIQDNNAVYGGGIGIRFSFLKFKNVTIQRNTGTRGGGIYIFSNANPNTVTFDSCLISNNEVTGNSTNGGGIYLEGSTTNNKIESIDLNILNSTISKNSAVEHGGGIYVLDSMWLNIQNSIIDSNTSHTYNRGGGGILVFKAKLTMENTTISNNETDGTGGGIFLNSIRNHKPIFKNVILYKNKCIGSGLGGGLSCYAVYQDIENLNFTENEAYEGAGFSSNYSGTSNGIMKLKNCLFLNNRASKGGATSFYGNGFGGTSSYIINCSLIKNNASIAGASIYAKTLIYFQNSIFYKNECDSNEVEMIVYSFNPSYSYIDNYNFVGNNNIGDSISPGFVNSNNSDYRLSPCSPLINKGNNSYLSIGDTFDLNFNNRILNDTVEIGAYEILEDVVFSTIFVKDTIFCKNEVIDSLNVVGTNLKWFKDFNLDTIVYEGNVLPKVFFSKTQKYYLKDSLSNCNSYFKDSINIKINEIPELIPSSSDSVICSGDNIQIYSSSTLLSDSIWWENGEIDSINYFPTTSTKYILNGKNSLGCYNKDTILITVNQTPVVFINSSDNNNEICIGDSIKLNAIGATNFTWNNGVIQNLYFQPSSTSVYNVVGENFGACKDTAEIEIVVNPLPNPNINYDNLNNFLTTDKFDQYIWYLNENVILNSNNEKIQPEISGKYYVEVINEFGCKNSSDTLEINLLGLKNENDIIIKIYPNPSQSKFTVTFSENLNLKNAKIIIYDLMGKVQLEQELLTTSKQITIEGLERGIYFARLVVNDEVLVSQKIIQE